MRLKFILNAPAQQKSGVVLACVAFVFPEVADWLTVHWLFLGPWLKMWSCGLVEV